MVKQRIQVVAAKDKPWPEGQIYMTAGDLARRYDVTSRTINRWLDAGFLPLDIDSQMTMKRWDIEELQEFEDDIISTFTCHN